jgi:hypothetical protein
MKPGAVFQEDRMVRRPVFRLFRFVLAWFGLLALSCPLLAQISGTGAITGTIHDPAGAVVPGASVTATNLATGLTRQVVSSGTGDFAIQLLQPGTYRVQVTKEGFAKADFPNIIVNVTQIASVNATLTVGSNSQTVNVQATEQMLETQSSTLGAVVTGQMVESLPLAVRNYTQIIDLSPGVSADVTNAGASGRGDTTQVTAGTVFSENNFQMNGVEINDLEGAGSFSGGVAIPNPDTIAEFKVQTSQYDASYGRNAGANVNVITKTGSNQFHGSIWEFFRNDTLNANDYFRKQTGQPRQELRQNQPGMTFGGPVKHDKAFFFLSYQSTRQLDGVDPECNAILNEPPLTNDRSQAALGTLFAGQPTFIQELTGLPLGPQVLPDGSNIAPQALALFNLKLPNGQYIIPTPQRINSALPFAAQGVSTISQVCPFNENQFMTNGDWEQSPSSQWQGRFFFANSQQELTLAGSPQIAPGFPEDVSDHFRNLSVTNIHIFRPNLLNQAEFGFHRTWQNLQQISPIQLSDIGSSAPSFDTQPFVVFNGSITLGGVGESVRFAQNTFVYQDTVSWTHGSHAFRFGGGATRAQINQGQFTTAAPEIFFGTYPDALLGQSGAQNGTPFSNMFVSADFASESQREIRALSYHAYAQDDYKVTPRLTLNLGFRFERIGDQSDNLGRVSNFNLGLANPTPPASGSLQGYVVASNFQGTVPAGVTKSSSKLPFAGDEQNTLNPRLGFAWQLPGSDRVVLRGGYGIYHETVTGNSNFQLIAAPPFSELRIFEGTQNAAANWAMPIPPFNGTFPSFPAYSPTTALSAYIFANNLRPPVIQHFGLNTQTELARNTVLEVGYLGTRGQHLLEDILPDQALSASPANPVRGQTSNTVANIPQRLPVEGLNAAGLIELATSSSSWYDALLVNFTRRFQKGPEVQIAYTWSRYLTDQTGYSTASFGGSKLGNQLNPKGNYGPDYFSRPSRLIANFVYQIPTPFRHTSLVGETLGGWSLSGVVTIQAGHFLYATNTNAENVFGINGSEQDFAEVTPACLASHNYGIPGSVGHKLNDYFNMSCFTSYPVVGADGIGTGFGNSGTGLLRGPAQNNIDLALQKTFTFRVRNTEASALFRAEAFNAFNTPQFADPGLAQDQATFGVINSLAVSPRIMQLAVKLSF